VRSLAWSIAVSFAAWSAAGCARSRNVDIADSHISAAARSTSSGSASLASNAGVGPSPDATPMDSDAAAASAASPLAAPEAAAADAHCIDAGAAKGTTVVRFVVHPNSVSVVGANCRETTFDLEVPSQRIRRVLCSSGCGPYRFVSHEGAPAHATFECDGDMTNTDGNVSVGGGVLLVEEQPVGPRGGVVPRLGQPVPAGNPSGERRSPRLGPPKREAIPLQCGSAVVLQTSTPTEWPPSGALSR
jgi:hypothetical protein